MRTAYCIEHQHSVMVQDSIVGECHEYPTYDEFGQLEYDVCFFNLGWATVEPVENPDWDEGLVEPGKNELDEMEMNVEVF